MTRSWIVVLAVAFLCGLCARTGRAQGGCVDLEVAAVYSDRPIDPGVNDLGIHCDDCTAPVAFPFPVRFYGMDYTSAVVSSNGNVQFAGNSSQYQDECLPTVNMDTTLFVLWDDLVLTGAGDGVFTSTTGAAPNRVFNVEWRAHYFGQPGTANFEVRFFEGSRNFELVYGTSTGQTYTVGVQKGRGELYRYMACNFGSPYDSGTVIVFTETFTGSRSSTLAIPVAQTDIGNHCDDCTTPVVFPFPIHFYGQAYTSAVASSNGNLQFASNNAAYANACLPVAGFGPTIFAYWDDLRTDGSGGIYTSVAGAAPFRNFDVSWGTHFFNDPQRTAIFTLRFFEGLDYTILRFFSSDQRGVGATMGTQAGDERYQEYWCDTLNAANAGDVYTFSLPPMCVLSPGGFVPSCTTDIGNHCDDCTTALALPFTVSLYGQDYTTARVSSNGTLQFGSDNAAYSNQCLPAPAFGTTIFAYWDDLRTDASGSGVFTRVVGAAPNRQLGIEWRATSFATGAAANFEVVLYESIPRFDLYSAALPDGGASATVGVQHGGGPEVLAYSCNATGRLPAWVQFTCLGAGPPPPCEVAITQQPVGTTACPAGPATFVVAASGTEPVGYQWRVQSPTNPAVWVPLVNGAMSLDGQPFATIAGAQGPTLTVTGYVAPQNSAVFECVASISCDNATSEPATLTICRADSTCDGRLDVSDFLGFLSLYASGDPRADYNRSGGIDVQDFLAFLSGYSAGC
jgi:hypothetical protein